MLFVTTLSCAFAENVTQGNVCDNRDRYAKTVPRNECYLNVCASRDEDAIRVQDSTEKFYVPRGPWCRFRFPVELGIRGRHFSGIFALPPIGREKVAFQRFDRAVRNRTLGRTRDEKNVLFVIFPGRPKTASAGIRHACMHVDSNVNAPSKNA